jgi:outer membrane protein TolC
MINKQIAILTSFCIFFWMAFPMNALIAQETIEISLSSAVDSAMRNNNKIKRYRQAVLEKEEMKKASVGNYFPSVDLIGGYTYISENPEVNMSKIKESVDDMFGKYGSFIASELGLSDEAQEVIYSKIVTQLGRLPAYNIVIDQQNYPNLNIVATQPIFMGGKIIAGKRFANAELDYAGAELQKVSNEIIRETIERYFGVVLLQQVVKVRREVVQGMKRHERDAKRAIEIGVIPAHEVLRAQVAVANAERDFIDDRNKLELANLGLKSSMGLPDEVELEITDSLVFKLVPGQVDSLKKEAFSQQPIFKMIDQKKLMVEQKHALERSEFMPQIAAWG